MTFGVLHAAMGQTSINIDGKLDEWTDIDRLDIAPDQRFPGFELYGRYENPYYYVAIKTDGIAIGQGTSIWLNTDGDTSTGFKIFGFAGGVEYSVDFMSDSQPYLREAPPVENTLALPLSHSFGAENTIVEVEIPAGLLSASPEEISLLFDVNDLVYLPSDYSLKLQYVISTKPIPWRTDYRKRIGIVYSQASADHFYNLRAYTQLFQAMQNQAMMAGIPFVLLDENDLTDTANVKDLDALVFPLFTHVTSNLVDAIENTLNDAVYRHRIGILTSEDFMIYDENGVVLPGDPYERQKRFIGVVGSDLGGPASFSVHAGNTKHPVMLDYAADEVILSYDQRYFASYEAADGVQSDVLASQVVGETKRNAILSTETGGRNVHFGKVAFLADSNVGWPALRWIVYGDATPVGLKIGRERSLFLTRIDLDSSMYRNLMENVELSLLELLLDWNAKYNYVCSCYINIGNDPETGKYTDWSVSAPLYRRFLGLGNEIGTHSYTHPYQIDALSATELEFEFKLSSLEIGRELGIEVLGAAVPGEAEKVETDLIIDPWLKYLSGTYSGPGLGCRTSIGYLTPDSDMMYFNINMRSEYTLMEFLGMSAEETEREWQESIRYLLSHASQPLIHWTWHDYGPTGVSDNDSDVGIYESTLALAWEQGTEFVTLADVYRRISTFMKSGLTVSEDESIEVQVQSDNAGHFSLEFGSDRVIQDVKGWYAYDSDSVFLPRNGGIFSIRLGDTQEHFTRIVALPMRTELISAEGDGNSIEFVVDGEGIVEVLLNSAITSEIGYTVKGTQSYTIDGKRMQIELSPNGIHHVSVHADKSDD